MTKGEELREMGYYDYLLLPNGREAALFNYIFTVAIISGFSSSGYSHRWCYKTHREALTALNDWNGQGEPTGWHRAMIEHQPIRKVCNGKIGVEGNDGQLRCVETDEVLIDGL